MKRAVVIVVVLAAVGWIGWKVFQKVVGSKGPEAKKAAPAVAVELARVRQATIHDIASFAGDLTARSQFVVAPKVAGRLVKLLKDIGDSVQNGELVAVLDDEEYVQQVEQAKAELEVAKASVDEARSQMETVQREFDRAEALRTKKIASESELDEARSQYRRALARHKVALSQVAQKWAALKTAEVRQSYTKITATWTGGGDSRMIGERFADTGAMLPANQPIVSVIHIDELTAVIYVTEREYGKVQVGQTVDISCDAYDQPFTGQVVRVAPLVKEASREARVEVKVVNTERLLRPGMFIRAQIELARYENATVIPRVALSRRGEKEGVFVADLKNKTAKFVPVTVGVEEGGLMQVRRPALEGDVVTLGQHQLEDGTAITFPGQEAPAGSRPAQADGAVQKAGAPS